MIVCHKQTNILVFQNISLMYSSERSSNAILPFACQWLFLYSNLWANTMPPSNRAFKSPLLVSGLPSSFEGCAAIMHSLSGWQGQMEMHGNWSELQQDERLYIQLLESILAYTGPGSQVRQRPLVAVLGGNNNVRNELKDSPHQCNCWETWPTWNPMWQRQR